MEYYQDGLEKKALAAIDRSLSSKPLQRTFLAKNLAKHLNDLNNGIGHRRNQSLANPQTQ